MSARSVTHGSFVLERTYDAPPARVFAAWADPAAKARWFSCHAEHEMDFRVGDRQMRADPGSFVYIPRGAPHTLSHAGDGRTRALGFVSPALGADYFSEIAAAFDKQPPDMEELGRLMAKYDMQPVAM